VLLTAAPASAATITHEVTFTPDFSTKPSSTVGPNGGTVTVTYKPSFSGDTPDLSGCGVADLKPIVMSYVISDQRPTTAYVGIPELSYTGSSGSQNASGGADFSVSTVRGTRALTANTGWAPITPAVDDPEKLAALRSQFNPTITARGGVLATAPFVPHPQPGANFVPTQQFTVTAGKAPALQPGITGYPVAWHTESFMVVTGGNGQLDRFGMAGSPDGTVGTRSADHGPGEASTVEIYWAETSGTPTDDPRPISTRVVFDKFSTTLTCESGAGPVVDRAIGTGAGSAALAVGAIAGAIVLKRRGRTQGS